MSNLTKNLPGIEAGISMPGDTGVNLNQPHPITPGDESQELLLEISDRLAQLPAEYTDLRTVMTVMLERQLRGDAPRYTLHSAGEALQPQPPITWIVDRLFSTGSVSVIFGEPGSKKTYSMLDLAVCVGLGVPWLNFATQKGSALLVDEESGTRRLLRRLAEVMRGHFADDTLPLSFTSLAQFNLLGEDDLAHLKGAIQATGAKLVILDALADFMPGGDENAVKDTLPVFRGLRSIAETTQSAIVVIHHAGKSGMYRGSSAICGAVDLMLEIKSETDSPNVSFEVTKTRDVEPFKFHAVCRWEDGTFDMLASPPRKEVFFNKSQRYVLTYLLNKTNAAKKDIEANADVCEPGTARNALYNLVDRGLAERVDQGGSGDAAIYALTEKGVEIAKTL
jgi:hypothetical protein